MSCFLTLNVLTLASQKSMFSSSANTLDSLKVIFDLSYRYLLFTSAFYLFFYVWKDKKYWHSKIQQWYPKRKHIIHEIKYSFFTILVFGAVILLVIWAANNGLTRVYSPI